MFLLPFSRRSQAKMQFGRDRNGGKIEIQMAPMVDIVFLLLVFFMVTASFIVEESELKISLPVVKAAVSAEELPDEVVIHIMSDGGIAVNEREYDSSGSKELPELRAVLSKLASIFSDQNVIIEADGHVSHGRVVDILNACVASGITNISFYLYAVETVASG